MSDVAIKLQAVSKYYKLYGNPKDRLKEALHPFNKKFHKPFYALKNLNLEIKKGDILGIVGRNGCGKSTLLKLIAGVLQPNEGSVSVKGKITALLELGAGFNPEFSGIDNVRFYASILGFTNEEIEEKLPSIIAFAELGTFLEQPVKIYSSGMKARLGFAVAVHVDPEILILDEVLSVGDALFRRKCYAKMEEFFNAGKTIIYVSHDANSVVKLCTRAVLIHQGKVVLDGEPKEVIKYYEKLLYSKDSKHPSIIKDIELANSSETDVSKVTYVEDSGVGSAFIEGLTPKSTVYFRGYEVDIISFGFETLAGVQVNRLVYGESYKFKARVNFQCDAKAVAFGFVIKDIKGQAVTSLESRKQSDYGDKIKVIKKGSIVDIDIGFPCLFVCGDYYIDLGVSSFSGEQQILTRGLDLSMFRVINSKPYSSGMVEIISSMNVMLDGESAIQINKGSNAI
jgi:lipopolysaccharide transport system ATP-binding protein